MEVSLDLFTTGWIAIVFQGLLILPRKHLSEDLCPYTCPFDECSNPEQLYITRASWMSHIQKEHRTTQYWKCPACYETEQFPTAAEFVSHCQESHGETISPEQMDLLVDTCRNAAVLDVSSCPLCLWPGETKSADPASLLDHIAEHIHEFSLRSLPWGPTTSDETRNITASYIKVMDWDLSWLDEGGDSISTRESLDAEGQEGLEGEAQEMTDIRFRWAASDGADESDGNDYFEQNEYFAESSGNASDAQVDLSVSDPSLSDRSWPESDTEAPPRSYDSASRRGSADVVEPFPDRPGPLLSFGSFTSGLSSRGGAAGELPSNYGNFGYLMQRGPSPTVPFAHNSTDCTSSPGVDLYVCDRCRGLYCPDHYNYDTHSCVDRRNWSHKGQRDETSSDLRQRD
jgi:hypothetical protein